MKTLSKICFVLFLMLLSLGGMQLKDSSSSFLDLTYANVEALASNEGGTGCKWGERETSSGVEKICMATGTGYTCNCGDVKYD